MAGRAETVKYSPWVTQAQEHGQHVAPGECMVSHMEATRTQLGHVESGSSLDHESSGGFTWPGPSTHWPGAMMTQGSRAHGCMEGITVIAVATQNTTRGHTHRPGPPSAHATRLLGLGTG